MSKTVRLAVLAALLLSIATVGLASAQGEVAGVDAAVTYTSGFQVQNLDAVDAATVQLEFYNQNGTLAVSPAPQYTIPANGSKTFFPINDISSGFNGSLVIVADKEVRAVSNLVGSGPGNYFAATNGFQAGSTTVSLPLIMCNNSGFNTFFNVQNAGDGDATVTINYVPGSNGTAGVSETATIAKGAAKTFDQTEGSATKNCAQLKDGSGKFIGGATITSTQPVVASVMQLNTTNFKVLMGYGGFTGGSATVALPLIMANNANYYTGIQVQNSGSAATNVTITYSANSAGANTPVAETFNLAAGASKTIIQSGTMAQSGSANDWTTLGRYIGSATVTNDGNQPLVAIVNEVRPSPALGAAYEGFNPATATTKISAALIMANNSSYYTGMQIQNVTNGTVNVTVKYSANTAGTFAPVDETFSLAPGASKTIIQNGTKAGGNGSVQDWTQKYIGSATITATGNVVAIVNQVSNTVAGDQFASSDAFNY